MNKTRIDENWFLPNSVNQFKEGHYPNYLNQLLVLIPLIFFVTRSPIFVSLRGGGGE